MEKPFRSKRRVARFGNSNYVLIPAYSKISKCKEVIVEVYENRVVITPAK